MSKIDYIVGDSKNLKTIFEVQELPCPQLIISSPPYFDVLNYEDNDNQIGHRSLDYDSYIQEVTTVYNDCYDLSSEDASLWIIIDTFKRDGAIKLLPFDLSNSLTRGNASWQLREVIIWDKEKNLPWNAKGKFKNQFEYILFFTKGERYHFNIDPLRDLLDLKKWWKTYPERYNANGKAPTNIWSFTTPIRGWGNSLQNHLCPIPFRLAERIITLSTVEGDTVLDPFAGSGTSLSLATLMRRNAIGIDINENYKELFEREVVVGAKRYWDSRIKELSKNEIALKDFGNTIVKLRKHKFAYLLSTTLKKNWPDLKYSIVIVLDNELTKYQLICYEDLDLSKIALDEVLISYLRQAKIKIKIEVVRPSEINKTHMLFQYVEKRFYKKNKKASVTDIFNLDSQFFYSPLELVLTAN